MFLYLLCAVIVASFVILNAALYVLKIDAGSDARSTLHDRRTRALSKAELTNYALGVVWTAFCLGYPYVAPGSSLATHLSQPGTAIAVVAAVMGGGVLSLSVLKLAQRLKAK